MDVKIPWPLTNPGLKEAVCLADIETPMRDGTVLFCDVYLPYCTGRFPALLVRTPYNKTDAGSLTYCHPSWYARHGYAVVIQDVRGKCTSGGDFYPFKNEADDGYDTIGWIARQPWCNGKVGMFGMSYYGATQLLASLANPPHLQTIVPGFTASDYYDGWTYKGGSLSLGFIESWATELAADVARKQGQSGLAEELFHAHLHVEQQYAHLPLNRFPLLDRTVAPFYFDWIEHECYDAYWEQWSIRARYRNIRVPALHIGGWYDIFLEGTIENFVGLTEKGGTAQTRAGQKLVIGPWWHMPWAARTGVLDFGPGAENFINDLQIRWFDCRLKGIHNGIETEPPVALFIMGINRWQFEEQWPPQGVSETAFYLHSTGRAKASSLGEGSLSLNPPGEEAPDIFVYDPKNPLPSVGGHSFCHASTPIMGPADQRNQGCRSDILIYESGPLTEALLVTGVVKLVLFAASSAADTDFSAKLIDVYPEGMCINICEGLVRAKYRESLREPSPIEKGMVYEYQVRLGSTGIVILPGHRIRLEVSSSNFPQFNRNSNTGLPQGEVTLWDLKMATQTIFHDGRYPSRLLLPVKSK